MIRGNGFGSLSSVEEGERRPVDRFCIDFKVFFLEPVGRTVAEFQVIYCLAFEKRWDGLTCLATALDVDRSVEGSVSRFSTRYVFHCEVTIDIFLIFHHFC